MTKRSPCERQNLNYLHARQNWIVCILECGRPAARYFSRHVVFKCSL